MSNSFTQDESDSGETTYERYFDVVTGVAFLITAIVAAKRTTRRPTGGGGAETTVVTAFYSLIFATSVLRALWFFVPATVWQPSYTPVALYAWETSDNAQLQQLLLLQHWFPAWMGAAASELVVTAGSLTLFAIFILILVYWADILKKYFHPGSRRSLPMATFVGLVGTLCVLEVINIALFLARRYTTEGMVLYNAILLAVVSIVCVIEITIFSHRFRTVLTTLGAINQVSTDNQVRRIVWITVTGNVFFLTRAVLETAFATSLLFYWHVHGTVQLQVSHLTWDVYTAIKYWSELVILALMLYILQSRFSGGGGAGSGGANGSGANGTGSSGPSGAAGGSYQKVPTSEAAAV